MQSLKLIALLLAAAMLLPLAACSDSPADTGTVPDDTQTAAPSDTVSGEAAAETTAERLTPDLEPANFNGYEFRVLTKGTSNAHWQSKDILAADLTGDPINDAVYERNSKICEQYNFKIVEIPVADYFNQGAEASTSIQANSDDYDMLCLKPEAVISSFITQGFLYDLNAIPNLDLEKPWYDQNALTQMSIAGKSFLVTGDMLTMDNDAIGGVFFNKGIAADLSLPNLYGMVKDGTWTIDKLTEYAELAANDLDGDGKMVAEKDRWGVETEWCLTACFAAGCGTSIVGKDANDLPYLTLLEDKYVNMLEKVLKVQTNRSVALYAEGITGYSDVWAECMDVVFQENRALFDCAWLNRAELFRGMETDFGILPYPKYDEAQKDYYCYVSMYCANSISIPKTVSDTALVGTIIEALSAESTYTLLPAYYEKTLKSKLSRDEESSAMLDVIFDSTLYCLGYMYNWGSVNSIVNNLGGTENADISGLASSVSKSEKGINKNLEKTIAAITEG